MKIITIILCLLGFLVKDSHENRVRLANGKTPDEGFIQIQINDTTWGTLLNYVYSYKNEPFLNAFVVCRMLNYTMAIKVEAVPYDTNNTYWPRALRCTGREETIQDCPDTMLNVSYKPPLSNKAVYAVCGNLSEDSATSSSTRTSEDLTTSSSTRSSNEQAPDMVNTSIVHNIIYKFRAHKSPSALEIAGIVVGILVVIAIMAACVVHTKNSPQPGTEEMNLNPLSEDQRA